jgi:hypothetical protein
VGGGLVLAKEARFVAFLACYHVEVGRSSFLLLTAKVLRINVKSISLNQPLFS